jgi:AraC-like DNA-binding protein
MADSCAEMVFHYKGVFSDPVEPNAVQSLSILQAPSREHRRYTTNESFGIFGVYLYPFVIPQLSGVSSLELAGKTMSLDLIARCDGKELEELIMLAPSTAARVEILTAFLEKKFASNQTKDTRIQQAIRHVIHTNGANTIEALAREFNISRRQFERKFKEHSGFNPKLYSRIIRFQSALRQYGDSSRNLTDIAYDCGYYDQSHFIHDFKAFSGYHPKQFFSYRAEGVEWRDV